MQRTQLSIENKEDRTTVQSGQVLNCIEWTSWTVKRWNEVDFDWLIFQEKSGGDSRGQQIARFHCIFSPTQTGRIYASYFSFTAPKQFAVSS